MDDTQGRYHRCGSCGYVIGPSEHTGELVGRCPTYCSTDAVTFTPTEITFPAAASREAIARDTRDVEAQIRQTYARLARPGGHVKLADLRAALPPDLDRETVDAALTKLGVHSDVHLWPNSDQKQATPADQAAALRYGGGYDHTMMIEAGPPSIADVYRRVKSTDRVHAESMLAPLDRWQLERLADRFDTADGRTGLIYTNWDDDTLRARLAQESAANHEAWLAKANQEVADGTLLYRADNEPEWVAGWTDEDRAAVGAAAQRQSQMDWDVGRQRGRRWLDRLGEMSQAERDGTQREPASGEDATERGAPCADDPARTRDPREQGVADGYAGGPYDEDLFTDEEHGAAYRAGLQEGRTAAVDEELIAIYGPEPTRSGTRRAPRPPECQPPNARYWHGFNAGRAMERGQQTTPIPTLARDGHYQRGIAEGRQSIRDGLNPPQFSAAYSPSQATAAEAGAHEPTADAADDAADGM